MTEAKKINTALISVFHKENLTSIVNKLHSLNIDILSTGGTKKFIEDLNIPVQSVESLTSYPSILGGRVKTLHPKVFGGILSRRDDENDQEALKSYDIPEIDLVIVDLYPFESTVASGAGEAEVIEKIDIGGIALIRASAKNYKDVLIISHQGQYQALEELLEEKQGYSDLNDRKKFAGEAFNISSHYDTQIFNYFNTTLDLPVFKESVLRGDKLRYGENPHQEGFFFGDFEAVFDKLHGKEISYNNLLDIDAAVALMTEYDETTFAVLKHNNACGIASREKLTEAWKDALAGDPVSAFGGILITNRQVDKETAIEIDKLFYEVIIAPSYHPDALDLLMQKKSRIILVQKLFQFPSYQYRTVLNGVLYQDKDNSMEGKEAMKPVTQKKPTEQEYTDLEFANKIVKHTKSNTIVLAKNKQLCASGVGQTSRVDALKQAIEKAKGFGFDLSGAVMASDAFFPFADSVEIAGNAGITAVVQPGGSKRDNDSIEYCDQHNMSMVFTGIRHFKH